MRCLLLQAGDSEGIHEIANSQDALAEFAVAHEGEAVADNTVDVGDLAPGLLALSDLFRRSNTLLNGDSATVNLRVNTIQPGSYELFLTQDQSFPGGPAELTKDFTVGAANLKALLLRTSGIVGLVGLLKRLRGQKPTVVDTDGNALVLEARQRRFSVPSNVYRLYEDHDIRRHLRTFTAPLLREGIERIRVRKHGEDLEVIERDDTESFTGDRERDTNAIVIPRQALTVIGPEFDPRHKWRLHDGASTNLYSMSDSDFQQKIRDGERFGAGDTLACEVRLIQTISDSGRISTEFQIMRVIDHQVSRNVLSYGVIQDYDDHL